MKPRRQHRNRRTFDCKYRIRSEFRWKAIVANIESDCSLVGLVPAVESPTRHSNRTTGQSGIAEFPMARSLADWDCSLSGLADTIASSCKVPRLLDTGSLHPPDMTRSGMAFVENSLVALFCWQNEKLKQQ